MVGEGLELIIAAELKGTLKEEGGKAVIRATGPFKGDATGGADLYDMTVVW